MKPNETRLQTYFLAQLSQLPGCAVIQSDGTLRGDPSFVAVFWRQNTGAARTGDRLIRFGVTGQPDITGAVRGRRVEIEVKTDTGKQSVEQRTFAAHLSQAGELYILARTLDDVLTPVRELIGEIT